jgi:hypothetical protein
MGTDYQNTFLESVNDRYQLHKDFAIKQITNKISPHIPTHSDTNTSILYHYTTLEGFKNIIEKGTLWGTNFAYLNDSTELNCTRSPPPALTEQHEELVQRYEGGIARPVLILWGHDAQGAR